MLQSTSRVEDSVQNEIDEVSGMQVEIPYVPAPQRPTKQVIQDEKDTIAVVGQARQRRKRKKGGQLNEKTKPVDASNLVGHQEPFDFSSVPNILDTNPDSGDDGNDDEVKQRKRLKKKKNGVSICCPILSTFISTLVSGVNFYGDFPAPPKANSEVRSGNKSYTFK